MLISLAMMPGAKQEQKKARSQGQASGGQDKIARKEQRAPGSRERKTAEERDKEADVAQTLAMQALGAFRG